MVGNGRKQLDNDAVKGMHGIADAARSVDSPYRPWSERTVLGIWTVSRVLTPFLPE
jgi:hypothetical protein